MKSVLLAVSAVAFAARVCAAQGFVPASVSRRLSAVQDQAASLAKSIATKESDGHTVYAKVGGRLEVYLPAQPGTGYGWYVVADDAKVLPQDGRPTLGELNPQRGMGREQMEIFVFSVRAAGKVSLRLEYKRPWEKDPPSRTWGVTVVAR